MTASGTELSAGLKNRHVTMISIAGVIGAGLFVGSADAIATAGRPSWSSWCSWPSRSVS
jgi:GABA permease